MKCTICKKPAIINLRYSKDAYCQQHFISTFDKKVIDTINKNKMLQYNDKVGVGVSGGKDSMITLFILNRLHKKGKLKHKPIGIAIDEGIKGYRDKSLVDLRKFCKEYDIELHEFSIKDEFGKTLDDFVKISDKKKMALKPCSICGVFRRYMLNKYSRELKLDKLATGHNLDDEIQSFMINLFRGDAARSARLGPITGVIRPKDFVLRIKPLYFTPEKESFLYSMIRKFPTHNYVCPYAHTAFRNEVRESMDQLEYKYPGTKFSTVKSSLRFIEIAKDAYSGLKEINNCKLCGEPTSKKTCKTCELIEKLIN
ncbi:MAG: TIGR00269 family protein [Candidatus Diapherotrites archaeon]|nr:TIGR00269 family protein [Candidatus Diapherotrites archaeon]